MKLIPDGLKLVMALIYGQTSYILQVCKAYRENVDCKASKESKENRDYPEHKAYRA
jgi:hypothetical protein